MARAMRRQLVSFSSKESTLVMRGRWALPPRLSTRILRKSAAPRPAQRGFQDISERGTLHGREEGADCQAAAMAPDPELAPVLGRIVHLHPHPIGIEFHLARRPAWRL